MNLSFQTSQPDLAQSQLKINTGSLLDSLDMETQVRVLEQRFIKQPLIIAENQFAKKIQESLMVKAHYDMTVGKFIRIKITRGGKLGEMGYLDPDGYIRIFTYRHKFYQSRLVYLWFTGILPDCTQQMDHIDGMRNNDHPSNLRIVDNKLNGRNKKMLTRNKSGYTGVFYHKVSGKYMAQTVVNGKPVYHGIFFFLTVEEASFARDTWIKNNPNYGFTTRHGT